MTDVEILSSTYSDTGTSYRREKVKNHDSGVTETIWVEVNKNFKCALSRSKRTELMKVDGIGKVYESYELFTVPNLDFKAGDKITIKTLMGTYDYIVSSKPFKYASHQEMFVVDNDMV